MAAFIYGCPVTGYNVQAFIADDPIRRSEDAFQSVTCAVCGQGSLGQSKNRESCRRSRADLREGIYGYANQTSGGFTSNLWLQLAALVIVVGVLIVLAALYIW